MTEDPPIVVVVGRRERSEDGSVNWTYVRVTGGTPGTRDITPQTVSEDGGFDQVLEISVIVEQTNSATDQERINAAARTLIQAIARARDALKASDRSRLISVNGVAVSLGALLSTLENTDFTVTDRTNFNNNGAGAANYNQAGGRHTSILNDRALIGPPLPGFDYANNPRFGEGVGMLAAVLHEIFHLSPAGFDFYLRSLSRWRAAGGTDSTFFTGRYAPNLEMFIDALTMQAFALLEIPTIPAAPPVSSLEPPQNPEDF